MKRILLSILRLVVTFTFFVSLVAVTTAPEWAKFYRYAPCAYRQCRYPQGYYAYSPVEWLLFMATSVLIFLIIQLYLYNQSHPKQKNWEKVKRDEVEKPKREFELTGMLTEDGEAVDDSISEFEHDMADEELPSLDELI